MAFRTRNLPSGHLWWNRWSDVSRWRKAIRIHFLNPKFRLKRLGRSRLSGFM
jgi:hypothetical protein